MSIAALVTNSRDGIALAVADSLSQKEEGRRTVIDKVTSGSGSGQRAWSHVMFVIVNRQ